MQGTFADPWNFYVQNIPTRQNRCSLSKNISPHHWWNLYGTQACVWINRQNNARHLKKIIAILGTDCTFGWRLATNLTSCPTWIQAWYCRHNAEICISLANRHKIAADTNMRAKQRGGSSQFADFLLSIGDGKEEHHKDKGHFFIKLPDDMTVENEKELLDFVFGGIENNYTDSAWLSIITLIHLSYQQWSRCHQQHDYEHISWRCQSIQEQWFGGRKWTSVPNWVS